MVTPNNRNFWGAYTLGEKINVMFDRNGSPKPGITVPSTFVRDRLMSKKAMLNECVHYDSQVMPFAYAANLSLDDVESEIISIKHLFGK